MSETERKLTRKPDRAVTDTEEIHQILDEGIIAHVGFIDPSANEPVVIPVAYGRVDNRIIFHGSTGSRLMRRLDEGQPTCLTVTLLDGLVLARSAFESSMNYRSVMVLGTARRLEGADALDALEVISEHLLPGRWAEIRHPSKKELAATMVLELALDECSVKIRTGDPEDLREDLEHPTFGALWAGAVPIAERFGEPEPSADCAPGTAVPDYVRRWTR